MLLGGEGGIAIPEKAFTFFERACALGEIGGCASLGALYEEGVGTDTNLEKASLLYAMACDGGDNQACEARSALDNKAFLGNKAACEEWHIQGVLSHGDGLRKRDKVYLSLQSLPHKPHKSCNGDDMASCTKVGFYYIEGLGVRPDFTQAHTFFQKACTNNYGPGCYSLGLLYFGRSGYPNRLVKPPSG